MAQPHSIPAGPPPKREPLGGYLATDVATELSYRNEFKDLAAPAVLPVETGGGCRTGGRRSSGGTGWPSG